MPKVRGKGLVEAVDARVRDERWSSPDDEVVLLAFRDLCTALGKLPTSETRPGPTPASRAALREWVGENAGLWHKNVDVVDWGDAQSRVVATGPLECGEVIFSIPTSVMMTGNKELMAKGLHETLALAVELCRGEPKFAAYIAALPATYDVPVAWSFETAAEVVGLSKSAFRRALGAKRAAARAFLDIGGDLVWDNFLWALGAVTTRQNAVPHLALAPAWDMCNHDPRGPRSQVVDDRLELRVETSLKKGDEVRMSYGDRSSLEFALYAGFVPDERCVKDRVTLEVDVSPNKLVCNLLRKAGVPGDQVFVGSITADLRPDDALRAIALGGSVLSDKKRIANLIRAGPCAAWAPLDDLHASDATAFLRRACDADLARRASANASVRLKFLLNETTTTTTSESHRRLARDLLHFEFALLQDAVTSLIIS